MQESRSTKPILLFGMPRSGTTWIGKIFDSHPAVSYLHEPDSVMANTNMPLLMSAAERFENGGKLEQQLQRWLRCTDEKVIASRPIFPKDYMAPWQQLVFSSSSYGIKALKRVIPSLRASPIRLVSARRPPVTVWKSIESLGRLPAFVEALDARGVHLIRHPCGAIASTLRGEASSQFASRDSAAQDMHLFEKLLAQSSSSVFSLDELKAMNPVQRLAVRWGLINEFAHESVATDTVTKLIYEDVCRSPVEKVTELFKRVDLPMSDATLAYLQESTTGHSESYYSTKKNPLKSAYAWRDSLSAEQQRDIQGIVGQFAVGRVYEHDW